MSLPPRRCLSVVVPSYNEEATVKELLLKVLASPWVAQVVLVDDGSTDGTLEAARSLVDPRLEIVALGRNAGKGSALREGFARASAGLVLVQDADLEYDPGEYGDLLEPLLAGKADVVYGSRFVSAKPHRVLYFWHFLANRILTTASNMATNLNLTDMETCYKVFRREVLEAIDLREDRFGFDPEVTAKVARGGWRVYEVGISYSGRTYQEGKKIAWRDGLRAAWCIFRYSPLGERLTGSAGTRSARRVAAGVTALRRSSPPVARTGRGRRRPGQRRRR